MSDKASDAKPPEFEPPMACVNRVIKGVLPENVQVTKDAKATFARAAGIFIFYVTHCANDFAREAKRQTIYASDILASLKELEFDEFVQPLEEFLEQHKKETESKKKPKAVAEKGPANALAAEDEDEEDEEP